jgi:N-sulfoglucosamine sulfohydrolase
MIWKMDPWEFKNLSEDQNFQNLRPVLNQMKTALMEWRQKTDDPFLVNSKLVKFMNEMDSINKLYPDYSYRNVENVKWGYLEYLNN